VASLRELQESFARALRDPTANCAVTPPANLDVYRNNTRSVFRSALEQIFPVVLRRVGDDYFRQLAFHYRAAFPSRSGDLHWVGRDFPGFLATHLRDTDYLWLADLARLEWARCEVSVAREERGIGVDALAAFAPTELERLAFTLQSSLRLVASPYPIYSVWQANQFENAPPMDQSLGAEYGMVRTSDGVADVQALSPDLFAFLTALSSGAALGEAMTAAEGDGERLTEMLAFVFQSSLVVAVKLRAEADTP
jgi:hypothetical protein